MPVVVVCSVDVAVGLGVSVPLGIELAVGEGPGVWIAVGGEVLLGVGVILGVGVVDGVGEGPGVAEFVAVGGTGVLDGVGVLVGGTGVLVGAFTVNEPPLVACGTPEPTGSVIVEAAKDKGNVPGDAPGRISKEILTTVPTVRSVGGSTTLNKMTLTVPDVGSEDPIIMPLAAGPRFTLSTLTRFASNVRSKFRPLISTPGSNARLIGIFRI